MNFNYEIDKMNPINISDEEFNAHEIPKAIRKSIAFYNRAIKSLKIRCVEMAINDLKRSLSLNPDFPEALKLLGLCYFYKKKYSKAEKVLNKLAKYDIYTVSANRYLQELKGDVTSAKGLDTIKNTDFDTDNYVKGDRVSRLSRNNKIKRSKNSGRKYAVLFLALAIIITISAAAYSKSSAIKSIFNSAGKVETKEDKELEKQRATREKNKRMDEKQKTLQKNFQVTKEELDNYNNKTILNSTLNDAEKFYYDGNYEKALDNLIILKSLKLDEMERSRFDRLWNSIKTNDVWTIYNQGNKLYKQGNYQEALPKLLKVEQVAPELDIMPWVLYQIGNCYKESKDNTKALTFFERVKSDYPNTEYAEYARGMISEINNK